MSRTSVMLHLAADDKITTNVKRIAGVDPYVELNLGEDTTVFASPEKLHEIATAVAAALAELRLGGVRVY